MCVMWESEVIGSCSSAQLTSSMNWNSSNRRGWDTPFPRPSRACLYGHFPKTEEKGSQEPPAKFASILTADIRAEMSLWEEYELPHEKPYAWAGLEGTIQLHVCLQPCLKAESFIRPSGIFGQKDYCPGLNWTNSRINLEASISDIKNNGSVWICPDQ